MGNPGVVMAGFGFAVAFVGVILLIVSLAVNAKTRSFAKCSESVTGRVGNKYVHHGKNQRFYSMDILYSVDGNEYKRPVPASLEEYQTLEEGAPFEIRYKPANPKKIIRADILSGKGAGSMRILLIVSAAMTVLGVALILIRIATVKM